jgi:hypothetical protein
MALEGSDRNLQKAWRDDIASSFVPLTTKLTSTSWDGDARSTTGATVIDLSAVFGAPAGVKAVLLAIDARDSGSFATLADFSVGPTAAGEIVLRLYGAINSAWRSMTVVCPCDANGDIYFSCAASGASTLNVYMSILGYWT